MNRSIAIVLCSAIPLLAGCINISKTSFQTPAPSADSVRFVEVSTDQLAARHAELVSEIAAIEREVEFKSGLHMSVFIGDDRSRLVDLRRESQMIERELMRRGAFQAPEALTAKL